MLKELREWSSAARVHIIMDVVRMHSETELNIRCPRNLCCKVEWIIKYILWQEIYLLHRSQRNCDKQWSKLACIWIQVLSYLAIFPQDMATILDRNGFFRWRTSQWYPRVWTAYEDLSFVVSPIFEVFRLRNRTHKRVLICIFLPSVGSGVSKN